MTKDEALKLALEALETSARNWPSDSVIEAITAIKEALAEQDSKDKEQAKTDSFVRQLDEALAQPWEKFCDSNCVWTDHHPDCKLAQPDQYAKGYADAMNWKVQNHLEHLPAAQPEQEPVANGKLKVTLQDTPTEIELSQYKKMLQAACADLGAINDSLGLDPNDGGAEPILLAIEELRGRSQEPMAWMVYTLDGASVCVTDNPSSFTPEHRALPLYTAPPQRKPLSDEQIILIVAECASSHQHTDIHFARAIEQAHGIKGEA